MEIPLIEYRMSGIATEILKFFEVDRHAEPIEGAPRIRTIEDLIDKLHSDGKIVKNLMRAVSKLKNEGLLISCGYVKPLAANTIYQERLVAMVLNKDELGYGCYDFLIEGFGLLAEHFKNSVVPVVIIDKYDKLDIGTGFIVHDKMIWTARHVIETAKRVQIQAPNGSLVTASSVTWPKDNRKDFACVNLSENYFTDVPKFRIRDHEVLEDILLMGYPPLPGFDAFQIYEQATISNTYKLSKGKVIGNEQSYLDRLNYFVINAKVKGGNSGSPVINASGYVVGMVVQIPGDPQDSERLDALGYGIATPVSELRLIWNQKDNRQHLNSFRVNNYDNGFEIAL
jgi:serine protease Do